MTHRFRVEPTVPCIVASHGTITRTAKERDVGVVIMKPFSCGRYFRLDPKVGFRDSNIFPPAKQSQIATAALKWILRNDMVHTIIPGMDDLHHVDDAYAASSSALTDKETELLDEIAARSPSYGDCYGYD